ncbi:DUF2986 domain-containing protein [Pseudomonas sp. MPC6]|uniref:DUF2986 domain-containing protein n=2 Tax=Pseudomonas TaxID=286 RepID=UPI0031FF436D
MQRDAPSARHRDLAQYFKLVSLKNLQAEQKNMNRRKKIKQLLKAHAKKASAKLAPPSKDKYISKADRLKLAAEESSPDSIGSAES